MARDSSSAVALLLRVEKKLRMSKAASESSAPSFRAAVPVGMSASRTSQREWRPPAARVDLTSPFFPAEHVHAVARRRSFSRNAFAPGQIFENVFQNFGLNFGSDIRHEYWAGLGRIW